MGFSHSAEMLPKSYSDQQSTLTPLPWFPLLFAGHLIANSYLLLQSLRAKGKSGVISSWTLEGIKRLHLAFLTMASPCISPHQKEHSTL